MKRFAKIIEMPETQVLVFLDYDDEQECTTMKVVMALNNGTRAQIGFGFDGEHQEEKSIKAMDRFGPVRARELLDSLNEAVGGTEEPS